MTTPLTDVKGIGGATATKLEGFGFDSAEALAAAAIEEIAACPGFGAARATTVHEAAIALLEPEEKAESEKSERKAAKPAKKIKKVKKMKKSKKAKKKAESKKAQTKKSGKGRKGQAKKKGKKKGKK